MFICIYTFTISNDILLTVECFRMHFFFFRVLGPVPGVHLLFQVPSGRSRTQYNFRRGMLQDSLHLVATSIRRPLCLQMATSFWW